jgi:hypothetical protein
MKPRTTIRTLLAVAIVSAVTLVPATAWAGCNLTFNPNPGYRGADVTISGFGFAASATYYVNFGGTPIKTGSTNQNGAFSFSYTIPNNFPTGTTNVFAYTDPSGCEANPNYQVNSGPPATTTTSTTTTTTLAPTTTTLAPTTTVAAPTTTVAAPTTTVAGGNTTTTVAATTTTTVAEEDDGGGIPLVVWIVIGVAAAVILLFLGRAMAGRRR